MAPLQEENIPRRTKAGFHLASPPKGEEVVISGISGYFPESNSVKEFRDNLFNKVDMITDDDRRWSPGNPEIPQRHGKIYNVNKFDASFFGIHYKQAHAMDPMCRLSLERAYEALVDAGVHPSSLKGTNTGVFVGSSFSESENTWLYNKLPIYGYGITGCSRAMMANRISYWLGLRGPSYTVDSACSSSLYAFQHAYKAIREGQCDSALVGGTNLCLHPAVTLNFMRLGVLSDIGMCRPFDEEGNGYCRSEAIVMVYLQKTKDAKRIYGTVLHAKTNCDGFKEEGITYPSGQMQGELLEEFYQECSIDPCILGYVEAHGTSTRVGDPEELNALVKVFCKNRKTPLPIGSVKSNIGHSEPASGLCSIAKVIIAFEENLIPPNLNYMTPRKEVEGLNNSQLRVVTEAEELDNGYIGVNSFGFGGANCHVLLHRNEKKKIKSKTLSDDLPYLVAVSGRTEESVNTILTDLETEEFDPEFIKLLHDLNSTSTPGHKYRGYTILSLKSGDSHIRDIQYFNGTHRPVCYFFSGIGSQTFNVGKPLMNIPVFANSVRNSHRLLETKGIDVVNILTSDDPKILNNIMNAIIKVVVTEVALVDVLTTIGAKPDSLIGHSVGELSCAYADGSLTATQTVMCAYYFGLVFNEIQHSSRSAAVIELGYKELEQLCPPELDILQHLSYSSSVVSGPRGAVRNFVKDLQRQKIVAWEEEKLNTMLHSRNVPEIEKKLKKYLNKVIPYPKSRSGKWMSTSVPKSDWLTSFAKYASPEYFINNVRNPVLLEEALENVPDNAIIIEIVPHENLIKSLDHLLAEDTLHLSLISKESNDHVSTLLESIGKMYIAGIDVKLDNLYPEVQYPVSRGTRMLSPLIKWDHRNDWFVVSVKLKEKMDSGERLVLFTLANEEFEYISGHVVDGRNLYPATGYIIMVWESMAIMHGKTMSDLSVAFENVRFLRATNVPKDVTGAIEFQIIIQKSSGCFEIIESETAIVTGKCYVLDNPEEEMLDLDPLEPEAGEDLIDLNTKDIYKELRLRGYNYSGLFRSLISADNLGKTGKIQWCGNWVTFMDNMLQIEVLQEDSRSLFVPTFIEKIIIDVNKHMTAVRNMDEIQSIPVYVYRNICVVQSGGIEMRGLRVSGITRRKPLGEPVLEKHLFVPHFGTTGMDVAQIVRVCVHIALENQDTIKVKVIEIIEQEHFPICVIFSPIIATILGELPLVQAFIKIFSPCDIKSVTELSSDIQIEDRKISSKQECNIIIATNLLQKPETLKSALGSLTKNGFIISHELSKETPTDLNDLEIEIALDLEFEQGRFFLIKKRIVEETSAVVKVDNDSFEWLGKLKPCLKEDSTVKDLILFSEKAELSGIMGFTNCIKREPKGHIVRCVFIMDENAPSFDLENPFYSTQLKRGLSFNIYKDGQWGTYRHLLLNDSLLKYHRHVYNNVVTRGDLSSLSWLQGPLRETGIIMKEFYELVEIYYSALNFRDVMTATARITPDVVAVGGRLEQDCVQGIEFSGRNKSGKRVMGMVTSKGLGNVVISDKRLMWEIPDDWTLEDAATIPVAYGTAYYSMVMYGNMQKGESILIHAGSGGVGQAAISIALHAGLTVFTTAGTEEKRNFLKKRFPQLTDKHIGNSRDTSFEQLIMRETNGRGVDMVLNSLAEEKLQASIRCLAFGGRFLEIGKFDLSRNNPIGLKSFANGISFRGVSMEKLFYATGAVKEELNKLLQEGINNGAVIPLTRVIFNSNEVEQAFRFMAAGKHIGKVLVSIRPEEEERVVIPKPYPMLSHPRLYCDPEKTIIIAGGLGGFGMELADWLVTRNARKLILTSRTGLKNGYQSYRVRVWRSYGVVVKISTSDIRTEEGVKSLFEEANKLGPVQSIFNLAVELHDALFENLTPDLFASSFAPKAIATTHLDKLSRTMCPELEHFVVFSSVSCGRGNAGQTNYGMANSIMERICEQRKHDGYPGLAIQWGAIGDVGLVADMQEEHKEVVIGGTLQQKISSCLQILDNFMNQPHAVVSSMVVAAKRGGVGSSGTLSECVANILGISDLKNISLHSNLAELGMDSMMAVEIKQTLEREFDVILTPQDIRSMTFARLAEISAAEGGEQTSLRTSAAPNVTSDGEEKDANISYDTVKVEFMFRAFGDEATASITVVTLPSKIPIASLASKGESESPVLIMIPGIEGMASIMEPLSKEINCRVLCLQYAPENKCETIEQLAAELFVHIKKNLPENKPFNILGYSFGGLVAMEIIRLFEKCGRTGRLMLVDSSPIYMKHLLHLCVSDENENIEQVNLLLSIINGFAPQSSAMFLKLFTELLQFETWDERVNYFINLDYENLLKYSTEHKKFLINSAYNRMRSVQKLDLNKNKKSISTPTLLIRTNVAPENIENDYGLLKFCKQVDVKIVESNHMNILEKSETAASVNKNIIY